MIGSHAKRRINAKLIVCGGSPVRSSKANSTHDAAAGLCALRRGSGLSAAAQSLGITSVLQPPHRNDTTLDAVAARNITKHYYEEAAPCQCSAAGGGYRADLTSGGHAPSVPARHGT